MRSLDGLARKSSLPSPWSLRRAPFSTPTRPAAAATAKRSFPTAAIPRTSRSPRSSCGFSWGSCKNTAQASDARLYAARAERWGSFALLEAPALLESDRQDTHGLVVMVQYVFLLATIIGPPPPANRVMRRVHDR